MAFGSGAGFGAFTEMPILAFVMTLVFRKGMPLYRKLQEAADKFVCLGEGGYCGNPCN